MNVQEALGRARVILDSAGVDDAMRDARKLMAACLTIEANRLTLHMQDPLPAAIEAAFFAKVQDRAQRVPMSHLLGYRDFYGRRFIVSPDVLDPRGDTETLIEAALSVPFNSVLDLGTGSGCIVLTLLAERAGTTGQGCDLSPEALQVAQRNARALCVDARCHFVQSDWFGAVDGRFDLIVSNPPYIALHEMAALAPELGFEPRIALTDEADGLTCYRSITVDASGYLTAGGSLMVEVGARQGPAVSDMFVEAGFENVAICRDLDGHDRVVSGQKPQ